MRLHVWFKGMVHQVWWLMGSPDGEDIVHLACGTRFPGRLAQPVMEDIDCMACVANLQLETSWR